MIRQLPKPRLYLEKSVVVVSSEKRQFDFKQLIEKCSENAVYTTAVRAAAQYLHSSETLTQSGVNSVIKIYGLAAMVDDAVEALSIAESKGVSLNVRHYNAVINVCRKHKRYDDALAVYERLLGASSSKPGGNGLFLCPDIASKSSIIGVLGEQGQWERALNIFREVKVEEKDTILFTTMLCTLEKCSRTSESLEVFEEMMMMSSSRTRSKEDSIKPSADSNSAVDSSKERKPDKANITPTIQMYTSVISVLGKNGDWERSWALFQNMQKEEGGLLALVPDKVLVFTMVRILEKAGQLEKAALVKQSSLKHFQQPFASEESSPSAPNFNDLIREGKRSGDFRAAESAADSWLLLDR
jgi:pentatricopeptide repeat protein